MPTAIANGQFMEGGFALDALLLWKPVMGKCIARLVAGQDQSATHCQSDNMHHRLPVTSHVHRADMRTQRDACQRRRSSHRSLNASNLPAAFRSRYALLRER